MRPGRFVCHVVGRILGPGEDGLRDVLGDGRAQGTQGEGLGLWIGLGFQIGVGVGCEIHPPHLTLAFRRVGGPPILHVVLYRLALPMPVFLAMGFPGYLFGLVLSDSGSACARPGWVYADGVVKSRLEDAVRLLHDASEPSWSATKGAQGLHVPLTSATALASTGWIASVSGGGETGAMPSATCSSSARTLCFRLLLLVKARLILFVLLRERLESSVSELEDDELEELLDELK